LTIFDHHYHQRHHAAAWTLPAIPIVRHKRVGYLRCYRAALVLFIIYEVSNRANATHHTVHVPFTHLSRTLHAPGFALSYPLP
jgi:hypothetical protein